MTPAWLAGLVPALLTIAVFSRIFGDNPVVRTLQYLFIGMSLGLAVVAVMHAVIRPAIEQLAQPQQNPNTLWLVIAAAGAALLLPLRRLRHRLPRALAALPIALLVGTSAAVMVLGLIEGTLLLQVRLAARVPSAEPAVISAVLIGIVVMAIVLWTLRTPAADSEASPFKRQLHWAGRAMLLVTYGVFLAAAVNGYLAALTERVTALLRWLQQLPMG